MAEKKKDEAVHIDTRVTDNVIEEKKRELEELVAKRANPQEYPKWVTDPSDPSKGYEVIDADHEARIRKGLGSGGEAGRGVVGGNTFDLTPEEQEAQRLAKAEADKDAANAKSRLAGPENPPEASDAPKKGFVEKAKAAVKKGR
jgi:hypothetical protein